MPPRRRPPAAPGSRYGQNAAPRPPTLRASRWFSGPLGAHHSFAPYEPTLQIKLSGVVTEFKWGNPHVYIAIDAVDDLTVRVNTNEPQLGLPAALSRAVAPEGSIMPKKYFEAVGEEEFRKKPVGSGPWKFLRRRCGAASAAAWREPLARHSAVW